MIRSKLKRGSVPGDRIKTFHSLEWTLTAPLELKGYGAMSEFLITYHSADEIVVAAIIKRLNELGIETATQTIANESLASEGPRGVRLVCWSPSLIDSTAVSADQGDDFSNRIDCLVAPCDIASHSNMIESLVGWNGAVEAPEWLALIAHIGGSLQRPGLIEASRALASGDEKERYEFAKRYPDEPLARNIWKHRETKHRQAFEHSIAFVRANFDRRVRTNWKRIEDMLKVYKTEFELWLEAERIGNAHALPQPRLLPGDIDDDFDRTGEAEAKAATLADQLAREYSRRRELSDRAARLEQRLNQSQAEATLRLQMATRALEAAHSKAQIVEREHAAVVVERNLLNHGLAALRSEVERLRPSRRRLRIVAGTMMTLAIAAGVVTSRYWPSAAAQNDPSVTFSRVNTGRLATKSPAPLLTKENVSGVVTDAFRIAPASVVAILSTRNDLFDAAQPNELRTFAARLAKVAPQAAIAEIVSARPHEVMAETLKAAPEIAISETVIAAPETALREILLKNPNMVMTFVAANAPTDAMVELLRTNSNLLAAAAGQPKLLAELVRTAPDATIDEIVRTNPRAFSNRLLNENADEIVSEIVKKQLDKTLSALFRTDSNELVAQVVRNYTNLAAAELVKTDPNAVIAAMLQREADKTITEAARTVPNALIAEVLRSNLPAIAREAIKVAPPALIAELVKERRSDFASAIATNDTETAIANPETTRTTDTPKTDTVAALPAANLPAPAERRPIPADASSAPAKPAGRSNGSVRPDQSSVRNEVVAQVSTEIARNIVNQVSPTALAVVTTNPATSPPSASTGSIRRDYALIQDCDLCPKLLTIPKGATLVGLRGDERLSREISDRSAPSRMVTIASPFALSESKITVAQFKAFMIDKHHTLEPSTKSCRNAAGRPFRDQELSYLAPGFDQTDTHPVVCVSWNDAVEYTRWLSEKSGKRYRLPTESEWEYSARAASSEPWRVAESLTESCKFGNILDSSAAAKKAAAERALAATCSDEWPYTSPAGAFAANGFGLFDMYGNAHEWVQDCWNDELSDLPADGSARNGENGSSQCTYEMRVRRGSGWTTPPSSSGLAARWKGTATHAFQDTGFRVLRELN
jgi:formylglycine-generating enzyme required for sulfatase activity